MKFIRDKEILLDSETDLLSRRNYVNTLKQVILNPPAEIDNSFTIGLFGEWGSGKSSIIRTVEKELVGEKDKKIKFILYDAWKYANDSFRRMLLLKIQENLRFDKTKLMNSFYLNEAEDVDVKYKFSTSYFIAIICIVFVLTALFVLFYDINSTIKITVSLLVSTCTMLFGILKNLIGELKINIQKPHLFAPEQFEECFNEMTHKSVNHTTFLNKLNNWVVGDKYVTDLNKLVIVVDNIDRCQKELAYELLTNIKNFLGHNNNIIFIIPVDDEALKRHIEHYNNDKCETEASEFLRKFFNVTIRLKMLKRYDIYSFAKKINETNNLGFVNTTIDIIGKEYASNPRRIIQLFNNLIAELENYEPDFAKSHETIICKMLILREEWPQYYKLICGNPYILNNPDNSEAKELINSTKSLSGYLRKTYAITKEIDIKVLTKILLSEDDFKGIPNNVIEAIDNIDEIPILDFALKTSSNMQLFIDYLIEGLDSYLDNSRFNSALNSFKIFLILNNTEKTQYDVNIRIQNVIISKLEQFLDTGCDNYNKYFVQYSEDISLQDLVYLKDFILKLVEDGYNKDNYKEISETQKSIFKSLITIYSDEYLNKAGQWFYKEYINNNVELEDYNVPESSLEYIITNDLIKHISSNIKAASDNDKAFLDLIYISKYFYIDKTGLEGIFTRINLIYQSNFSNQNKDQIISIIKSVNLLLDNISDASKIEALNIFYQAITKRTVNNVSTKISNEIISDNDKEEVFLDFLTNIYRTTTNTISTVNEFNDMTTSESTFSKVKNRFILLKEKHNYSLKPLYDIILKDTSFDSDSFNLIKYISTYKENNNYALSVDKLHQILVVLLNEAVKEKGFGKATTFAEMLLEDERVTDGVIKIIIESSKEKILSLSKKLQELAFDFICSNNRLINEYKNENDLLKAIAEKGSTTHVKALTAVILEKLLHNELIQAIELIDSIKNISSKDTKKLSAQLQDIETEDSEMSNNIRRAILKLKGELPNSIFDKEENTQQEMKENDIN